ncbi:hypothetical protein GALMADRAFT_32587, partial [Galerina marginata CBS 339.88]
APTLTLPPLGRLVTHSTETVRRALQNLKRLYFPAPSSSTVLSSSPLAIPKRRIQHPIHDTSVPDSGYASAEEDDDDKDDAVTTELLTSESEIDTELDILRADPLERSFSIKWVTGFVTRSSDWISACASEEQSEERSEILDEATALLSSFIGKEDEEDVAITRKFSFPLTLNDHADGNSGQQIRVELNDAPLSKDDHTSVGLQSWGSCILLADRFCLQPFFFSLAASTGNKPLRILELGAGTGMLSIVTAKLLQPSCAVDIVATDYHPDVLENLSKNIETNFPISSFPLAPVKVEALDWEKPNYKAPFDRPFNVILAADVIYHPNHAQWIKRCVEELLTPPDSTSGTEGGVFWLFIPVRTTGRHEGMDATVEDLFPDVSSIVGKCFSEPRLAVTYREEVGRQGGVGRADEGAYKLFKIRW